MDNQNNGGVLAAAINNIQNAPVQPISDNNPVKRTIEELKQNDTATATATGQNITMKVSVEGIMQNKAKIDISANDLDTLYRAIKAQIDAINNSWVGPDATAYIEKINKLDPKIDAAIAALRKISTTYKTALDEIENNQQNIKNSI